MMKWILALAAATLPAPADAVAELSNKVWNRGAADCAANQDPAIEIRQADADTYVLRQNKCVHFEAPFIYVLFGDHTVFVQDTGATADAVQFPLYQVVQSLIAQRDRRPGAAPLRVLVTHSHSHGDHTAADAQFRGKPGVRLIEPDPNAVRQYFKLADWPAGSATIDLGARRLVVLPAPGHQDESIAVYDAKTGWLLTGDTVYPGMLYVKDWNVYRSSIGRLVEFARAHPVSAVMGTHVEMSRTPGKLYPRGSTFQPDETALALTVEDLFALHESLQRAGAKPQEITLTKFVVAPIGTFQRVLGNFLKWIGVR
jgi:glyoxylase-like metal-dependent hydrolase (beta-lactamase superfamily II)